MAKLQARTGGDNTKKENIGIQALVSQLREEKPNLPQVADLEIKVEKPKTNTPKIENRVEETGDSNKLLQILNLINEKDYSCKEVLYVDEDIKEVFQMLKSKGKVPISALVSYILEDWIKQNIEDINAVINSKNKYI